jgi:aquaporin Z
MIGQLQHHWQEYLMEAAGLGLFMISACLFTVLLMHPASPIGHWIVNPLLKRAVIGIAMGLTAIALIYSPWGKQSGAHFNPSVTLAFFRLGKVAAWDAFLYIVSQFLGAITGVFICAILLAPWISDPQVNYAVTTPGSPGPRVAFISEFAISFLLMTTVLLVSNSKKLPAFTGVFAGVLVATYITLEAPLSGMSMNPARTFGSALPPHIWSYLWVYFTAPPIGMLVAAEIYHRLAGTDNVMCAKLHHGTDKRCIFHCGYRAREFRRMLELIEDMEAQTFLRTTVPPELAGRISGKGEGMS